MKSYCIFSSILLAVLILFTSPLLLYGHNNVVVIPVFRDFPQIKNIVTVGLANADFTDPVSAMSSILDADGNNPYLMVIGPGNYAIESPLVIKPWGNVVGSGWEVTVITGTFGGGIRDESAAMVVAKDVNFVSSLANLSLAVNGGGAVYSIGIYNANSDIRIEGVDVSVIQGQNNYSVVNTNAFGATSNPRIINSSFTAKFGSNNYGVYNDAGSGKPYLHGVNIDAGGSSVASYGIFNAESASLIFDVTIIVNGGPGENYGIYNFDSQGIINNVDVLVEGGSASYGIYNTSQDMTQIRNSQVEVTGNPDFSYGIYNDSFSSTIIESSTMSGMVAGLYIHTNATEVKVINSRITNGVVDNASGSQQCRGNYALATLLTVSC